MNGTLLIRNARLDGRMTDALIRDGVFQTIAPHIAVPQQGTPTLDAGGKILAPAFYNAHCHAAMTLLRGYADDMELFTWLNKFIWPAEGRLTTQDIYEGTRLAIIEMIHSGTVFFNDMYWEPEISLKAADEMGVRAAIGRLYIEESPGKILERNVLSTQALESAYRESAAKDRLLLTYAPHAIYSVSGITLRRIAETAKQDGGIIHIHASETRHEVEECQKANKMSPIAWLDTCGLLTPRTILAHCVHLSEADIALIRNRGSVAVHMPCSNYKLCSGAFDFRAVYETGHCRVALGTDGCASNNNLSMFDEMKFAALSAKLRSGDPACAKAEDVWRIATRESAEAFGIHAGVIGEGWLGDCILLDPDSPHLVPEHNLAANMVYSADTSCVDTVICAGRILMQDKAIPGERDIISAARACAKRLSGK
jgi:5-methylthioadenosine/S-adenosylhomocysteine deaminase